MFINNQSQTVLTKFYFQSIICVKMLNKIDQTNILKCKKRETALNKREEARNYLYRTPNLKVIAGSSFGNSMEVNSIELITDTEKREERRWQPSRRVFFQK